jgi:hypothetical protein
MYKNATKKLHIIEYKDAISFINKYILKNDKC